MEALKDRLLKLVEPIVEENDVELVDLEVKGSSRIILIRVFVDVAGGININECVRLSRLIEDAIEMENLIPGQYRLEVSSPGLDRPLRTPRDFQRNIGRLVEIRYTPSEEETRTECGDIVGADDTSVTILKQDQERLPIPLAQIQKALIQIKW